MLLPLSHCMWQDTLHFPQGKNVHTRNESGVANTTFHTLVFLVVIGLCDHTLKNMPYTHTLLLTFSQVYKYITQGTCAHSGTSMYMYDGTELDSIESITASDSCQR